MIASATLPMDDDGPAHRFAVTPAVEGLVLAIAVAIGVASYFIITGADTPQRLLPPPVVALLLVANLVPGIALLMLLGRRVAMRRAARSPVGGGGRLHVRLVALFSIVAAVPMLLVTIFASLLFQYGVQFWYSDQARGMLENATTLAQSSYARQLSRWEEATVTMAADMSGYLREKSLESPDFSGYFLQQVYYRSLSEAALFKVTPQNEIQTFAVVDPYKIDFARQVTPQSIAQLRAGKSAVVAVTGDRIQTITLLPGSNELFLYAGRVEDTKLLSSQTIRANEVLTSYRSLLARARSLQLRFNAALLVISLLIVGVAVWIALAVADRLVRPVGELVDAARRVAGGDLTARVPDPRSRDEVGTLANAFNQMTGQLEEQNTELVTANGQLENRRALIEAVMAGVSAGVVATGRERTITIANDSAVTLLGTDAGGLVGRKLVDVAPELDAMLDGGDREAIVEVGQGGDVRTLAVRIARPATGPILTFDDITQQLLDQRRAAWSDVARRIAHEIKNPLTPIQLAAERLQRRYGAKAEMQDGTFSRLTDTIIRQVGDLRRMVDEFSSFARMPKPVFREESLVDAARQALFLHEVAHPLIGFHLVNDDPGLALVCDRRQIGQALTNIVKNAVEAIDTKGEPGGSVTMTLSQEPGRSVTIAVADTGVGLPADRDRIMEPYVTTRARGTGLGLAIVKKIIEEHCGTIGFSDRPGGGTIVTMIFDTRALAALDQGGLDQGGLDSRGALAEGAGDGQLATMTRNRT
ncbi:two-component system nitrogen regulation sensor histidine kinase NtrY [Sphingomonas sp. BK036]|uniref:sensor histidine kinase n=1 Tax=Sphingomonas sp. BK036 TaxID=2512122 RepID=UPI0010292342|nr:ATP-binding protein [Sphingomonas sp. BK036]RZT53108.1 two-component system nitrogen regulation sensor histidine kinase NtrY [Sphingomonas sp. BK036]